MLRFVDYSRTSFISCVRICNPQGHTVGGEIVPKFAGWAVRLFRTQALCRRERQTGFLHSALNSRHTLVGAIAIVAHLPDPLPSPSERSVEDAGSDWRSKRGGCGWLIAVRCSTTTRT